MRVTNVIPKPPVHPDLNIELTHHEARLLATIVLYVQWGNSNQMHEFAEDLSDRLSCMGAKAYCADVEFDDSNADLCFDITDEECK